MSGKNHPLNQLTTKSSVQTQVKYLSMLSTSKPRDETQTKAVKNRGEEKKYNFPFLPRDKLDPNVYPSSAKQPPLPAREFCTARCRRLSLCLWGQTPPAHRKEKIHIRKQRSKTLLCSLHGVASAAFSAHKVLYVSFVPKFPF